jgi:hypothetical protein
MVDFELFGSLSAGEAARCWRAFCLTFRLTGRPPASIPARFRRSTPRSVAS